MFKTLTIEGYRGIDKLTLDNLARINLLVGKNNCGKTSALEAVELIGARNLLETAREIAFRRGEVGHYLDRESKRRDAAHLGRFISNWPDWNSPRAAIRCSAANNGSEQDHLLVLERINHESNDNGVKFVDKHESTFQAVRGVGSHSAVTQALDSPSILIYVGGHGAQVSLVDISTVKMRAEGLESLESSPQVRAPRPPNGTPNTARSGIGPALVVPVGGMGNRELADRLAHFQGHNDYAGDIESFIRAIDPSLRQYVIEEPDKEARNQRSAVTLLAEGGRKIPASAVGDGVWRALTVGVGILDSAPHSGNGGVLLVDEIDTGLHYTAMASIWRLVYDLASRYEVQVFATTHSEDCLRGLAEACEGFEKPDVRVHRISQGKEVAVSYSPEETIHAVEYSIEMR